MRSPKQSSCRFQLTTHSPEETRTIGQKFGAVAEPGMVLAFIGDLGSGKTVFIQGVARGLEVPQDYYIASPTYTLINEYPGRSPLYHVDLYRIDRHSDIEDIGLFEILHGNGVVVIEWADRVRKDLLSAHLEIRLKIIDDESRQLCFAAYGQREKNLIKRLSQNQISHF